MSAPKPKILIVDDHSDGLELYTTVMVAAGYDVVGAESIAEAKRLCSERQFDLIVSDIKLRDGSGIDLLKDLQAACRVRAIALSGLAYTQDIERSAAAGFMAHITKPVDLDELERTVATVLKADLPVLPL